MSRATIFRNFATRPIEVLKNLPELTESQLNAHPAGHPNSIAWLLWHSGRELDMQLTALTGAEELWVRSGFRARFSLGDAGDEMGYGHTPEQAHSIVVKQLQPLVEYVSACLVAVCEYADSLDNDDWEEIIDRSWEPPVDRETRLVSIVYDAVQHVAQVSYILGMEEFPQTS